MSFRKQPGSCKDGHFRVSSVISILRSSASLPWLLQMTIRRFWPHLWRSNTLQCSSCCTPSKWGLQSIRIICITIICAVCLALKDVFLEVPFAHRLQVWYSSSVATKHVWETRISNTTCYWWPIYHDSLRIMQCSTIWVHYSRILVTIDTLALPKAYSMLSKQPVTLPWCTCCTHL